jgi:prepilin-type N-terminal cleavage/methylation domain-containing protein
MIKITENPQRGFTMIEVGVVLLVIGAVAALATPRITGAMREYRANIATRQIVDTIKRVKTQAISENKKMAMMIDTANHKAGLAVYKADGTTIDQVYYVPLPQGVSFQRPADNSAPPGVQSAAMVSFPSYSGSTTVFKQDFTSRGFPVVANASDVLSIFVGNGQTFRAITMSSAGGVRIYMSDGKSGTWKDARTGY